MRKKHKNAFTLIEVLMATFILVIMVMILSRIFHQSSVSWSAGVRRAKDSMTGRSTIGFMARELMNAANDPIIFNEKSSWDGKSTITFVGLVGDDNQRVARRITYQFGLEEKLVKRTEQKIDPDAPYATWRPAEYDDQWTMVTNAATIFFYTPDNVEVPQGSLPPWVKIRLTLNRSDDVSGVGARSFGPDGRPDTPDDIVSW